MYYTSLSGIGQVSVKGGNSNGLGGEGGGGRLKMYFS